MKKSFFRILPAVILLVSAVVVLGGCEKKKEPPAPQDIDIIDTTKAVSFKEILPISADTVQTNTLCLHSLHESQICLPILHISSP